MDKSEKITAIYLRVSSKAQNLRSQEVDLKRWAEVNAPNGKFYRDKFTGRTLDRPAWNRLQAAIDSGQVDRLVVWKLDRLGRSVKDLSKLLADLQKRKINFVSLRDGCDMSTPNGRLLINLLSSIAEFENEIRTERILAGQSAARAESRRWGGSVKGRRLKVSDEQLKAIVAMKGRGERVTTIAKTVSLDRTTIHRLLSRIATGDIVV